jgi:putative oxidoreductase
MIRNPLLRTLTRASLVVLFPVSAADKLFNWRQAVKQAKSGPAPLARAAPELLLAGMAVEAISPFCIVTGWRDREAAALLAGFCASTALLYHPFWTHNDLFAKGKSTGREELWEFLKNFGLVGGLMSVVLDDRRIEASLEPRSKNDRIAERRRG